MTTPYCLGIGVGTQNQDGDWLEVFYPKPLLRPSESIINMIRECTHYQEGSAEIGLSSELASRLQDQLQEHDRELANLVKSFVNASRPTVLCIIGEDSAPATVPAAYLKLQLLSHRLVKPHETELQGIFGVLPNVAWTSQGAIDLKELTARQTQARSQGEQLSVFCVDKFPKMTDYVVPSGVRIADTARVRLGAHIGEGTTIMHEGFVNFNAGTLGTSMVEGRISAGVVVGEGSDLGGGCSTMGTLSGGGNIIISVGKNCLIGANAGIGIPLGDRCIVEAGLYITAGTKAILLDADNQPVRELKAQELAGKADLLFRRNSLSGAVECKTHQSAIELNEALHAHN